MGISRTTLTGQSMKLPLLRSWPIMAALLLVPVASSAQAPVRGTYRLFLCATRCTEADSAQAVAVATVVIAAEPVNEFETPGG